MRTFILSALVALAVGIAGLAGADPTLAAVGAPGINTTAKVKSPIETVALVCRNERVCRNRGGVRVCRTERVCHERAPVVVVPPPVVVKPAVTCRNIRVCHNRAGVRICKVERVCRSRW